MRLLFLLLFVGFDGVRAVTHSLKYFYTASSGIPNFPEFVVAGLVDGVEAVHYDSNTGKAEPKRNWMNKVTGYEPGYWKRQTDIAVGEQQVFRGNIEIVKQRLNQTGGVHVLQLMYGCEWDDDGNQVTGYYQFGYDGEDLISLDPQEMESWVAPKPEGVITKHKWDKDRALTSYWKNYLTQTCPEWVKKYVNYGRSSLMRTDLPSVSVHQKSSSSPVRCHATGFYPNRAEMFWRKDGEEFHEGVDKGETVPNDDGTFQMTVDLHLPPSEDWTKYECVFQLAGVDQDIVTKLEKESKIVVIAIVVALVVLAVAGVVGFVVYKKKSNDKRPPSPESQESNEKMLPKA